MYQNKITQKQNQQNNSEVESSLSGSYPQPNNLYFIHNKENIIYLFV